MKTYLQGSHPSIRVPVREIALTDGTSHVVYDTSGPYSDASASVDIRNGLAPLRESWIDDRSDTERLERPSSVYRRGREAMVTLARCEPGIAAQMPSSRLSSRTMLRSGARLSSCAKASARRNLAGSWPTLRQRGATS